MERWWDEPYTPPRLYIGRHITTHRMVPEVEYKRFHHYDPETGLVTFWDNSFSVPEVVAEAQRLGEAATGALAVPEAPEA